MRTCIDEPGLQSPAKLHQHEERDSEGAPVYQSSGPSTDTLSTTCPAAQPPSPQPQPHPPSPSQILRAECSVLQCSVLSAQCSRSRPRSHAGMQMLSFSVPSARYLTPPNTKCRTRPRKVSGKPGFDFTCIQV